MMKMKNNFDVELNTKKMIEFISVHLHMKRMQMYRNKFYHFFRRDAREYAFFLDYFSASCFNSS